ncbi:MAG TPA: ABC transporter permease [Planctomycetota bacterium]|nr:ABC transporter permease [Planctomycetota bacterium]
MFDSILRILALTRKELLAVVKDPRSRVTLFLPTLIQCVIYGYAATYDLNHVSYVVLDQDRGAAAHEILAALDGSGIFTRVANVSSAAEYKAYVNEERALLGIQFEQDFERRLQSGQSAGIQILADGRNSNTAGLATGYISMIVEAFNANWRTAHNSDAPAVRITSRAWYNPNLQTRWHMVPALLGTLSLIQVLMLTALSVAREREQGTFDQLLVTPFRAPEIMAGKSLPAALIGLAQVTIVLIIAQFWFHIPFSGSFLTLFAALSVFILAAAGIGLMVSSIAATMQQAMLYNFMLIMPFTLLSGLTTPVSSMPLSLQYVTLLNPLRYAIEIAHRIYLEGAGFVELWPLMWPLLIIAAVTLTAASFMFRKMT